MPLRIQTSTTGAAHPPPPTPLPPKLHATAVTLYDPAAEFILLLESADLCQSSPDTVPDQRLLGEWNAF